MAEDEEEIENALPPGTLFGRYRIEKQLGAGAMGAVYAATHMGLNKPVVVKVLLPHHARSREIRQRFLREGESAARIRHPHVVDVTDVGMHEQTPFLVMERLEGQSLGALLDGGAPLEQDAAIDLLLPIIAAVDAAHAVGVVHRDLKPENLFISLTPSGEAHPKVLDFGISRVLSDDAARQTGTTDILGTPAYMAPEQITSARDVDAQSDQYALGVILYECLTGARAFNGSNVYATLRDVGAGAFLPPRAVRPEVPAELEAIVLRAMALEPSARFPTLREFAAALLPYASERARYLWQSTFRASSITPAPAAPPVQREPTEDLSSQDRVPTLPRRDDTLARSVGVLDTVPQAPPRTRRTVWAVAAVAVLIVGGAALAFRGGAPRNDSPPSGPALAARPSAPTTLVVPAAPVDAQAAPNDPTEPLAPTPVALPATPPPQTTAAATHASTRHHHAAGHRPRVAHAPSTPASPGIDIPP